MDWRLDLRRLRTAARAAGRLRTGWRVGLSLIAVLAALSAAPALADEAAIANGERLGALCGIVENAATQEGLPISFLTRLIWRESAFQSGVVSWAGAQGIAQFMPVTASESGLTDPFDPAAAIPASAKLLAALARRFGNLGMAAAAYNAGENAVAGWLAGKGILPLETQDYVLAVTSRTIEEWRDASPPSTLAPADKPCLTSVESLRVAHNPEGAPIAASFAQSSGLWSVGGARPGKYSAIGHMQLLRLAADANMTPRAYVQFSLKDSGIDVKDDHLLDPRKVTKRTRTGAAGGPSL
jgi:Transglycosylase SLT domain